MQTLPENLATQLRKVKNANTGIFNKRQLYFGILDQAIHSADNINSAEISAKLLEEVMGIQSTPGTNTLSSFGHLAGGYDSAYYGYLWSEVYSLDMFYTRFGEEKLFDKKAGFEYRTKILAHGGSKDALDMLKDFLGREPNNAAFLKDKGLKV
ncbi:hypothetical protein RFI_04352 [Reticulomyxa filosa]|uniref:Peptidase M3A/M3B catalytic domain-containing protein n=1 Tax=Reticulomyxa filosa TaxID=46433 RepID=X6P3R1_RETFI|nr:hypothetical protein RFI_04352 [Reticulomyxa filosa]|eukprot:ETO32763.1 hypothetical protein RFI_04352 [Reticulomyxa filosa]